MSYLRVTGFGAPVKMFNILDMTMWHRSSVAYFFGTSMGVISSQGKDRFGGRLFGGVEFFHHDRVPVHLAVDLITKWCDEDEYHRCPQNEQAFWAAGRLGVRF
jgi:hypothetical protein